MIWYRDINATLQLLQPHEVSPEYLKGRAAKNAAPADKAKPAAKETKKKPLAITYPDKVSLNFHSNIQRYLPLKKRCTREHWLARLRP